MKMKNKKEKVSFAENGKPIMGTWFETTAYTTTENDNTDEVLLNKDGEETTLRAVIATISVNDVTFVKQGGGVFSKAF